MKNDFDSLLRQLRAETAESGSSLFDQGRRFEHLIKRFLEVDPITFAQRFKQVWVWKDWPHRNREPDTGIDLVAQERDSGEYCAIQCKFHQSRSINPSTGRFRTHTLSQEDLATFQAAASRKWGVKGDVVFGSSLLVATCGLNKRAQKALDSQRPPCQILDFHALRRRPITWPDLNQPESLVRSRIERFKPRGHQEEAIRRICEGFESHDRGRLILPCGTGKTFTALTLAERYVGAGGRVLVVVPSIALLGQTMREFCAHRRLEHRYIGVCSDVKAGYETEDSRINELEIPVTTEATKIKEALARNATDQLTIVFCTYQSLPLIEKAQADGGPEFDLAFADEAHRTTGVERSSETKSPFLLIHDGGAIRAKKRLYMTATPRLYTEAARDKAVEEGAGIYSMDDEEKYGPEMYRMEFSAAIERGLLSDFKVLILQIHESAFHGALQKEIAKAEGGSEINLSDTARLLGCWQALQDPANVRSLGGGEGEITPLRKAIAFTNRIKDSMRVADAWTRLIVRKGGKEAGAAQHIDGTMSALDRQRLIDWLRTDEVPPDPEDEDASAATNAECRILTNARCLSEGIDVPALDAVLFLHGRSSQVDIVQAVGRVMRKAEGKSYGYIILPIAIPPGQDPGRALDRSSAYDVVWEVLRALRSHDDRFSAWVNQLGLRSDPASIVEDGPILIQSIGSGAEEEGEATGDAKPIQMDLSALEELPAGAIYARIVEKVGDRQYWENWAKDVAEIAARVEDRIGHLVRMKKFKLGFVRLLKELKKAINDSVDEKEAQSMLAQHVVTGPVFDALFGSSKFAKHNPVSKALSGFINDMEKEGLQNETREMQDFYDSVRRRVKALDDSDSRQKVLMELYEKFFATALKKTAVRLGVVYTPHEIVDFILHSAEHALRKHFNCGLTSQNVHVLDPFAGTGTFLVRLLKSKLIAKRDLSRKFRDELHANEIMLLAYYIAAIHIEEAYHGRLGKKSAYMPFPGIVFGDTFNLGAQQTLSDQMLEENESRRRRQRGKKINVIVGNPPYSAGQTSADDNNQNVEYPDLFDLVEKTYAWRSRVTNRNSLYDSYKLALCWATDRICGGGVISFVTNGSFIDATTDAGIRACLAEQFDAVYCLNLKGNARTQGKRRQQEGDNIFGQGTKVPIAITTLVRKDQDSERRQGRIYYAEIDDFAKQKQKQDFLRNTGSIAGIEWCEVVPDEHHDWINLRDESFQKFLPMGDKATKAGKSKTALFRLYSSGVKTNRDTWMYNFDKNALIRHTKQMADAYENVRRTVSVGENIDQAISDTGVSFGWDEEIRNGLRHDKHAPHSPRLIQKALYRPFVKSWQYSHPAYISRAYKTPSIFPPAPPL